MIDAVGAGKTPQRIELEKMARSFEAMFVQMLMKSMRETVHKSGFMDGGAGEQTFTALLDQTIADRSAESGRGLGIAQMILKKYGKHSSVTAPKIDTKG